MATPRTGHSGETTRRTRGGTGADADSPGAPPVSTARWIGVVIVLGALGGAILMAGGGRDGGKPPAGTPTLRVTAGASPTAPPGESLPSPPTVIPLIDAPPEPLTAKRTWTARVTIPDPGVPLRTLDLVVYRNGQKLSTQRLKNDATITVRNIALKRGENRIAMALANAGGAGPKSPQIVITVDDLAPRIDLREPRNNDLVYSTVVTVRGFTEVGATVTVRNDTRSEGGRVEVDDRGVFRTDLALADGRNVLIVKAVDALGNQSTETLTVTRAANAVDATLKLSDDVFRLRQLPTTITATVQVRDAAGKGVEGALVTFSVSPSGLPTRTYDTATVEGVAKWSDIRLPQEGATIGDGFVTARVTLPGGLVVPLSRHFRFK